MRQCAFLSMTDLNAYECYDYLLFKPLANYGWQAREVSWNDTSVNWDDYDVVLIRSPWDYQNHVQHFLRVLKTIEQSSARLENALEIVIWNLNKTYLKKLQTKGIPIVPTQWLQHLNAEKLTALSKEKNHPEYIIKPVVSANADNTFRVDKNVSSHQRKEILKVFEQRPAMIQPFMDHILTEGEFSLFYFGGEYSHAILKTPAQGDFRVQEEHGGKLRLVTPGDTLKKIGDQVLHALPEMPLYARVDLVRTHEDTFALMELELIEPSLYFNMDPESPERFAKHFHKRMQNC